MLTLSNFTSVSASPLSASLRQHDWLEYKSRYIKPGGYVIDTGQSGVVHSEGQSYGMLLAVFYDDQHTFDQIWQWAQTHLQIRDDNLFAWKWDNASKKVADINNATDADIVIAWSLYLAADKWNNQEYKFSADMILSDLKSLVYEQNGSLYLLPGAQGFRRNNGVELNPSYLILPAFKFFAQYHQGITWSRLYQSSIDMLYAARFGNWQLAPDWLLLKKNGFAPSDQHKHRFSYDAIRIPLFAAWVENTELVKPYLTFWKQFDMQKQAIPDSVNLDNNYVHFGKHFSAPRSVFELCKAVMKDKQASFPDMQWKPDTKYYDASISLLAQIAWITAFSHKKIRPQPTAVEQRTKGLPNRIIHE